MFELDIPFVLVESAPRKRGKTHFNKHLLPFIEDKFRIIHIYTPSLDYKEDYWEEFHKNPKYVLHSNTTDQELETVIADQQKYIKAEEVKRRKDVLDKEDEQDQKKKRKGKVQFDAAYLNGRRKRRKRGWTITHAPNVEIFFDPPDKKYTFLMPEIYTGENINLTAKPKKDPKKILDILIILDDCADQGLFSGVGPATVIAIRGRHFHTSLICSTQLLTKVAFVIRANVDYLLFWRPHTVQEMESFIEKFVSKNGVRLFRKLMQHAFKKAHEFILLDPHALEFKDVFAIGEAANFLNGSMKPLFSESQVAALLDN